MATTRSFGSRHSTRVKAHPSPAQRDPKSPKTLPLSRASPRASRRPKKSQKSKVVLPASNQQRLSCSEKDVKPNAPDRRAETASRHRRQQPRAFPLLDLPRELRDLILSNLLTYRNLDILDNGKFTTYNTSYKLRAQYTLTTRYPRNVLLVNHQLHDEFIDIIVRQSQLRIQIGPYVRSYGTHEVVPRKTRQSAGEPNWNIIRRMKKCTAMARFDLRMQGLDRIRDDALEFAWCAMFWMLYDFIIHYGSDLEELYLELQLLSTVVTEENGNPFQLIKNLSHTEKFLRLPCLRRVTVVETKKSRYIARWEKTRPQLLCLGEAEAEYFHSSDKLRWFGVFDDDL